MYRNANCAGEESRVECQRERVGGEGFGMCIYFLLAMGGVRTDGKFPLPICTHEVK